MTIKINQSSKVKLRLEDSKLTLDYPINSEKAIYDICSMEGRILLTGELESRGPLSIDISTMKKGYYNIFILDGGEVLKEQFMLAS